ncbi:MULTISPECIES: exodeoxyribonuclease I [Stutzerimonas stutzeri subgroup]|uniref:Exodeoxyribonuclease I n=1 Tax=Stutzerimonas stutzeri NF13 TaxID=1212548 RepID=M2UIT2_STUST|nr:MULTISPECIES: exodeoxyribonuclease I [Stutzerimonas stutzeri subgroup]EMD98364.1 exonuclease I [Stutzerimonas stutzeri NF13]MBK3880326.1 exodeoxyribonuclease I [Stutzerimonas stutzeri]MCQ4292533.1 exodeoxyribonuclease I [Stutzerimonas stutzeri]WOF80349.1 exodeoxyribonuclease I [Pseudomonas sp. FeN3W]
MNSSIFWYDFETTGISPSRDRPLQVAGIRTNEALEEIGEPLNIYCRPSDDILPHPAACLVTGITPATLEQRGVCEAEFIHRLHQQLSMPGTCGAGYNSLRFDDEVTRYSLYRNFYDPYAREWQGGNSRWDLIDLIRTAYALRPEGLIWPEEEGRVTLKLERLSVANGLEHLNAHDALSDVRATIALARLIRDRQPRLYDYLYNLRRKQAVLEQIRLLEPMVHVSGRFSAARHFLSVVLPLGWHPRNRNALIVCDLQAGPEPLLQETAETLRQRLYTRRDQLADGELPVPLKLVHVNKCPVVAPLKVLRAEDIQRLALDMSLCHERAAMLREQRQIWSTKLEDIYREERFAGTDDPEQQLYDGFLGERDRRLCDQVRSLSPAELAKQPFRFDDARLEELLFRYRARNFPEALSVDEQAQWRQFCQQRLSDGAYGAPNTLAQFELDIEQFMVGATPAQRQLLQQWREHGQGLRERYRLSN